MDSDQMAGRIERAAGRHVLATGCSQDGVGGLSGVDRLETSRIAPEPGRRSAVKRTRAVNPGPGSFRLLAMLARLGAAGVEPLAHLLGLSTGTTYSHLRRLERDGLVWRVRVGDGGGGAVAVSRNGALRVRDEGLPAVAPTSQVPSTGAHARAVSWAAAYYEHIAGCRWLGPAELRVDRAAWRVVRSDSKGHLPDLGLIRDGKRLALEVELHSKGNDRVRSILHGYRWKIDDGSLYKVGYITTKPAVARLVARQAVAVHLRGDLALMPLDGIVEKVRKRAQER